MLPPTLGVPTAGLKASLFSVRSSNPVHRSHHIIYARNGLLCSIRTAFFLMACGQAVPLVLNSDPFPLNSAFLYHFASSSEGLSLHFCPVWLIAPFPPSRECQWRFPGVHIMVTEELWQRPLPIGHPFSSQAPRTRLRHEHMNCIP